MNRRPAKPVTAEKPPPVTFMTWVSLTPPPPRPTASGWKGRDFSLCGKSVTVASCPVSNLKLASGFCPAPRLLQEGVSVALGTDGVASNNNLNLLEEVKLFATLFKATSADPTAISARRPSGPPHGPAPWLRPGGLRPHAHRNAGGSHCAGISAGVLISIPVMIWWGMWSLPPRAVTCA
jgi:hypothetical protein